MSLSQTQFAAKLGLDAANLSKIENDRRILDERKLATLAEIAGVELEAIKVEYYSCLIASELYKSGCGLEILTTVEQKFKQLRESKTFQASLNI